MSIIPLILKEFDAEAGITRKMFERVPNDQWTWKPHEKSLNMQQLTVHIAELPSWVRMALTTTELDFVAVPYEPTLVNDREELLAIFNKALEEGRNALGNAKEEDLLPDWTLRNGEQVYSVMTKYEVIRHSMSQTTHHRAQLGVYLRLLIYLSPEAMGQVLMKWILVDWSKHVCAKI